MRLATRGISPYTINDTDFDSPILQTCIPQRVIIPILQCGKQAMEVIARPRTKIREGQIIAQSENGMGIHSSIPGIVESVDRIVISKSSSSFVNCSAVHIQLSGDFDFTGRNNYPANWLQHSADQLIDTIEQKGVVQLDGSGESLATVLRRGQYAPECKVIVNSAFGTPYLSSEICILKEYPEKILTAIQIVQHILKNSTIYFAYNQLNQCKHFLKKTPDFNLRLKIQALSQLYPAGSRQQLYQKFSQKNNKNIIILTISTLLALYEAVVLQKGLSEMIITLGGSLLQKNITLKVRIGTPISTIFQELGFANFDKARIINGLPINGTIIQDIHSPISYLTNSIFVLGESELLASTKIPCTQCGSCVEHCPANIEPIILHKLLEKNQIKKAVDHNLLSCWKCGICSHVCPSNIPLLEIFEKGIHISQTEQVYE